MITNQEIHDMWERAFSLDRDRNPLEHLLLIKPKKVDNTKETTAPAFEELITIWKTKEAEMMEEIKKGNPNNRSMVDLMYPTQMLCNLNAMKEYDRNYSK